MEAAQFAFGGDELQDIVDAVNQEKYFCHVSGLIDTIAENDNVSFELEKGAKGMNAVRVTLVK